MRNCGISSFQEAALKIIVARHCQTDWNAQNRVQGVMDTKLNAEGHRQAGTLAANVAGLGITLIVSSDLTRAAQTASTVALVAGIPFRLDPRLRECSFGSLDGLHFTEFGLRCGPKNMAIWPDVLASDFTPFGGDKGMDVFLRQKELLDQLKAVHDGQTVMIIGHGRSLRTLLVALGHARKVAPQGEYLTIEY